MLKVWLLLIWAGWVGLALAVAANDSGRFSQSISTADRPALGIERLSSDQLAVLDALVRRDAASRLEGPGEGEPSSFSQRLTADERRNAGVALLSADEIFRLDAAVARHAVGSMARSLLAPPSVYAPHRSAARTNDRKKGLETHGSVSLSYGWGGGYETKSGSMVVNMSDPNRRYSVTIGYGETHVSGPEGAVIYTGPRTLGAYPPFSPLGGLGGGYELRP